MSAFNLAGIVGAEAGAALTSALGVTETEHAGLAPLLAACAAASLLPLPFVGWLREVEEDEAGTGGGAGAEASD